MSRKVNPETEARWRAIVDRQAASGLSVREFCAKQHVSEPSFYGWRRKLVGGRRAKTKQSARPARKSPDKRSFIPLALMDSPAALELVHPLGYRIRLAGNVDTDVLNSVLSVLDERRQA
jgi:hypothetical protein